MERKRKPLSQLRLDEVVPVKRSKSQDDDSSVSSDGRIQNRAGTISHMILKNFMCHSFLEVNLKSNINYVIGRNGSGKSAILTALIVGLGGKATLTNRGSSIKSFIKAGKPSGSVEITLSNTGHMAYKGNIYGKTITVIRNFTANGSSSYRIKSASGETISNSARDVQHMCASLNIQIDNPICLLNQDISRNFLNTKDPHHKFILFMRATQLDTLLEQYKTINSNKKNSIRMLTEKDVMFQDLKKQMAELKRKLDNHRNIISLNGKAQQLQLEVLWAKVRDSEVEFEEHKGLLNNLEEQVNLSAETVASGSQRSESVKQKLDALQQQINELKQTISEHNKPQVELKRKLDGLKETLNEKRRENHIIRKDIENKNKDCQVLEQEIANLTENFNRIEQEKQQRLAEMASLDEKITAMKRLLETSKNDQFQMKNSVSRKQEEDFNLQTEIDTAEINIANAQRRINSLKNESNNVLSLYGRDMPQVIQAIEAAKNKFRQMPRGPLGSYIKLKDKRWAAAVEGYLTSGVLKAFAVDNKEDNKLLLSILDRTWTTGPKPMIITSTFVFQPIDVSRNLVKSQDQCVSLFDALDISDPVVLNSIIDAKGIESILLIPNNEKAIELMSNAAQVPRNCRQGITVAGDTYFPDPNYRTYCPQNRNARYLQVSAGDVIQQLKETISNLMDKKKTVQNQRESVSVELRDQREKLKALEVKITKVNRAALHLERQLTELQNSADPDVANVNSLENELLELRHAIQQRQAIIEQIEKDVEDCKQQISESQDQMKILNKTNSGLVGRMESLQEQTREQIQARKDMTVNDQFEKRRLDELKNRLNVARSRMQEQQKLVQEQTEQASLVGERLQQLRDIPAIMIELAETNRAITRIEAEIEKPEELLQKYSETLEMHQKAAEIMRTLKEDIKELEIASNNRNKNYKYIEDYYVTYIKSSFQNVLEYRQFQGSLEIDMKEKKLDMIVIPQQGSQGYTSTSNLSGGERSFSTVAFLYALWQCMEFPFYFLDEFDVFMDKVNRSKVMQVLIHHAKTHPNLQFIFLTPQDVSFINDPDVAIHRLEDPKRRCVE